MGRLWESWVHYVSQEIPIRFVLLPFNLLYATYMAGFLEETVTDDFLIAHQTNAVTSVLIERLLTHWYWGLPSQGTDFVVLWRFLYWWWHDFCQQCALLKYQLLANSRWPCKNLMFTQFGSGWFTLVNLTINSFSWRYMTILYRGFFPETTFNSKRKAISK